MVVAVDMTVVVVVVVVVIIVAARIANDKTKEAQELYEKEMAEREKNKGRKIGEIFRPSFLLSIVKADLTCYLFVLPCL